MMRGILSILLNNTKKIMDQEKKVQHPEGCKCKGCVGYACSHNGLCGWAGCGRSFSWIRLVVAVLLGLFIFSAGIELGEMKAAAYMGYGGMEGHHGRNGEIMQWYGRDNGTTTVVIPATTPTTPTTTPAVPAR
jgi:hypothetical protein